MHPFEATFSVVGAIVLGIIVLTLFFKMVGWFDRRSEVSDPRRFHLKGILDDETWATVHLGNGLTFETVRLVGFTDAPSFKGGPLPFELQGMIILEHTDGRRTLVQPKLIRMIEVPPKQA